MHFFLLCLFPAKEFGLQQIGSFRCLNGKLDLTTFEAEHTLRYWKDELERLRKEMSVRTIAKEISTATVPYTIKVLAYKNGDGKRRPGELIIGSSISGVSVETGWGGMVCFGLMPFRCPVNMYSGLGWEGLRQEQ